MKSVTRGAYWSRLHEVGLLEEHIGHEVHEVGLLEEHIGHEVHEVGLLEEHIGQPRFMKSVY